MMCDEETRSKESEFLSEILRETAQCNQHCEWKREPFLKIILHDMANIPPGNVAKFVKDRIDMHPFEKCEECILKITEALADENGISPLIISRGIQILPSYPIKKLVKN